jgi:hypothetical protein
MMAMGEIQVAEKILTGVVIGNVKDICDHCGEHKADVDLVIDPYARDVDNVIVSRQLCGDCIDILCDGI